MGQPFRLPPARPAAAYQTYRYTSPPDVTVRSACEQAGCLAWRHGWRTVVDEATTTGSGQAAYIRHRSGRDFREQRTGALTVFTFTPRQRCFAEHHTRPQIYQVRRGDWRENLGVIRDHLTAADWVEDFAAHQQRIADRLAAG